MRTAVAVLAILTSGGMSRALADPPGTPPTSEAPSTAGQKSPADEGTGRSTAAATVPAIPAPAATTPTAAPAKPIPSASDETQAEKSLRDQGYKPAMRNGEKVFCRREAELGSRLANKLHCMTVAEAELIAKEGRETTERLQRSTAGCLAGAHGPVCN